MLVQREVLKFINLEEYMSLLNYVISLKYIILINSFN